MKVGDRVRLTEDARTKVPWYTLNDVEYTVVDVLENTPNIPCNIVVNNQQFGKDWVQFFKEEELIPQL